MAGSSSGTGTGAAGGGTTSGEICTAQELRLICEAMEFPCSCGQWCAASAFIQQTEGYGDVCETPCTSTQDCANAASICSTTDTPINPAEVGPTCTPNVCPSDAGAGAACDVDVAGAGGGTCVPQSVIPLYFGSPPVRLCIPNGTAATCVQGTTNDDSFYQTFSEGHFIIAGPQPRDPSTFCGSGQGCYVPLAAALPPDDGGGNCVQLCAGMDGGSSPPCGQGTLCQLQAPGDPSWGFCLPCVSSGSDGGEAGSCLSNADCCESSCAILPGNTYGSCAPGG